MGISEEPTTTQGPPTMPPSSPCDENTQDDGWITTDQLPDYCYLKVDEAKIWQGANDDCVSKGGFLVSIHSIEENNLISALYPGPVSVWSGLIKVHKGGQRHWSDNSAYDFDFWDEGGM